MKKILLLLILLYSFSFGYGSYITSSEYSYHASKCYSSKTYYTPNSRDGYYIVGDTDSWQVTIGNVVTSCVSESKYKSNSSFYGSNYPDRKRSSFDFCNGTDIKIFDSVIKSCNPDQGIFNPVENAISYNSNTDELICKYGYSSSVSTNLSINTNPTTGQSETFYYNSYSCNLDSIEVPPDTGTGPTDTGTGSTGSTDTGTGSTGSTGSTGTGSTGSTGSTDTILNSINDNIDNSNSLLNDLNNNTNSMNSDIGNILNESNQKLDSINNNLQDEEGNQYLKKQTDFYKNLNTPLDDTQKQSISNDINSNVNNTLDSAFSKYSNILGFGSSYGSAPDNITLNIYGKNFVLLDFSLLNPYINIIRSLFLSLAYLYGFMNLLRGVK